MSFRRHLVPITADPRPPRQAPRTLPVPEPVVEGPSAHSERAPARTAPVAWVGVACVAAFSAVISAVAADARWLAALGHAITARGGIPDGVPFASAPTHGWPNVPALAEVIFGALDSLAGARGLQVAQVAAVTIACCLVALDARRLGAGDGSTVFVLIMMIPAAFGAIVAVRAQLFSLALFPALVVVLRAETRRPSRLIWLVPPLLGLWSNLHGAALTGLAVAGAYLLLDRARREPLVAGGVLAASLVALCATPALWHTPSYYARRPRWRGGPPGHRPVGAVLVLVGPDIATLVCLALAAWPIARSRPRPWELVALAGLVVLAARTSRGAVWVVLLAAPLAAAGLPWRDLRRGRVVPLVLGVCGAARRVRYRLAAP